MNKLKLSLLLKQKFSCPLLPAIKTQWIDVFKSHIHIKNYTFILDLNLLNLDLLPDVLISCIPNVNRTISNGHLRYLSDLKDNMTETLTQYRNITGDEIFINDLTTNTSVFAIFKRDINSFLCLPEAKIIINNKSANCSKNNTSWFNETLY